MPKSDWRKLETLLDDLANQAGIVTIRNADGNLLGAKAGTFNLTELARELADHVTLSLPEPIQVKS